MIFLPFYILHLKAKVDKAKKQAEEANKAKGQFLANMSHEMRTPLNGVIAMADILRETGLNESQREITETLSNSGQLLLAQIEDVLDMAKIEAGRVELETAPFDLGRLLTSTVKVLLPQARYKGLAVITDIAPSLALVPRRPASPAAGRAEPALLTRSSSPSGARFPFARGCSKPLTMSRACESRFRTLGSASHPRSRPRSSSRSRRPTTR